MQFPGLYRKNNVPHWQRVHQAHDGLRQWQKGPYAARLLPAYHFLLWSTLGATMYMMCRMVLGKKTWY
ncbi:Isocitrate lyase [Teratosphaeria destructans]|uniref:Isocitrate lyase n=1 Tax=Teratosphaeria destructans TaxID=418781 RepID=A0A9W7SWQ2_9PEZI|nr:Isocitrate lyase [Teratosphaeria destructans]